MNHRMIYCKTCGYYKSHRYSHKKEIKLGHDEIWICNVCGKKKTLLRIAQREGLLGWDYTVPLAAEFSINKIKIERN